MILNQICRAVLLAAVSLALIVALLCRCAWAIDIRPVLAEDASLMTNRSFAQGFLLAAGGGGGGSSSPGNLSQDEASVLELWQTYDKGLRGQVDNLLRQALPYLLEIGDVGIDIRCAQSLLKIVFGLRKLEKWAFQRELPLQLHSPLYRTSLVICLLTPASGLHGHVMWTMRVFA
ncbi:hypothetical protein HPB48_002439 [Haemaphysalis longicornis]|uniref:Uncharacterized protein n=1 Tax=Haemaphysalis longicornis TaxID=44386 RepID=A0A9J6FBC0_HAELO|nr:hypothetical protein HPB48_002439 [Haemaphysalis longicornis]